MKLFIILLLSLHIVPFLISEFIICDHLSDYNRYWHKRVLIIGTVFNLITNFLSMVIIYKIFYGFGNPILKFKSFFNLQCSYQDVGRLGIVLLILIALSVIFGGGVRLTLQRISETL
jgi:hypothetical protein